MPEKTIGGMRPKFKPYPHQKKAIDRLVTNNGALVMAHGTGSGKTFTAIYGTERIGGRALVVVPAGLRKNFSDAVKEFTTSSYQVIGPKKEGGISISGVVPGKKFTVVSYSMFRKAPETLMAQTGADTLIFDEYHRARDPNGSTYKAAMKARGMAKNFMGLTGSVVSNDPVDVVPLINIANNGEFMSPRQFDSRYKRRVARSKNFFGGKKYIATMTNLEDLGHRIRPSVDFVSSEDLGKDMPKKSVERIDVQMSDRQRKLYDYAMNDVSPLVRMKIRMNLPVNQKEAFHIFSRIQQARQAANSIHTLDKRITAAQSSYDTPKVKRLLDDTMAHLKDTPDAQIVIYSNLIRGGIDVLAAGLTDRGISHGAFIGKGRDVGAGKVTNESRNQGVTDFLSGKKKVILVSGAGAEGLDLKNATMFQSLDGHFNPERTLQAEARARRIKGLAHRPVKDRQVMVRRYFSVNPEPGFLGKVFGKKRDSTTDEWIHTVAMRKNSLNEMLRKLIKPDPANPILPAAPTPSPTAGKNEAIGAALTQAAAKNPVPVEQKGPKEPVKHTRKWYDNLKRRWRYKYPEKPDAMKVPQAPKFKVASTNLLALKREYEQRAR